MEKSRRHACDACYIQKTRCVPLRTATPPDQSDGPYCRQCRSLGISCTFDRQRRTVARGARSTLTGGRPLFAHELSPGPRTGDQGSRPVQGQRTSALRSDGLSPNLDSICLDSRTTHSRQSLWASFSHCSIDTLGRLLKEYFQTLYSITPIIDRSSFQSYFSEPDSCGVAEPEAFALALSACAYYTATYPRKFIDYQTQDASLSQLSCRKFLFSCEKFLLSLRPLEYFEISTHEKCVTGYFMALTTGAIGLSGRARLHIMETKYHIQQLGYDSPRSYRGLSAVQAEVARRTYWLYVVTVLHEHVGYEEENALWEPFSSDGLFRQDDFEFLSSVHPVREIDFHEGANLVSTGLRFLIKVFLNFLRPDAVDCPASPGATLLGPPSPATSDQSILHTNPYEIMLTRIKHSLDDVPPSLAFYSEYHLPSFTDRGEMNAHSFNRAGTIRVNLQVSRIWAMSLIFERLVLSKQDTSPLLAQSAGTLVTRIQIVEELLAFIENADMPSFEANSPSITYKVRQIARPLLNPAPNVEQSLADHALEVLRKILTFLADLNRFSLQDTQYLEGIEKYQSIYNLDSH
ncbi:hypothetical protein BJX64DRAFT_268684 [Aspergillus heterothallicus]